VLADATEVAEHDLARIEAALVAQLGQRTQDRREAARAVAVAEVDQREPIVARLVGELARADLLLLLSYGREQLFLPAKLFDYMAAGAPVLCVAPRSELTEIVAATKIGGSCDPDDIEACAEIIMAAARRRRGLSEEPLRDPTGAALEPYTARATTAALARVLDQVLA
ncbi:MAG TPA: hypothetical protein VM869_10680, partial [Enhygromyxa sp.]|nr:hypothetical protein [Enhygromyxa sp.]